MTTFPGDGAEKDEYQPVDQETAGHGCVQLNVAVVPAEAGVLGAIFRFLLGLGGYKWPCIDCLCNPAG